jgi:hypothetical protein
MAVCRDLVEVGFDTSQARVLGFDTATTRQNFTPTVTPLSPMTLVSSSVIRQPSWQYIGDGLIYYQGHLQVELGGTASNRIDVTCPIASSNSQEGFSCYVRDASSGNLVLGYAELVPTGGLIRIYKNDRTNWTLGTGRRICWRVIYEVDAVL